MPVKELQFGKARLTDYARERLLESLPHPNQDPDAVVRTCEQRFARIVGKSTAKGTLKVKQED